MGYLLDGKWQSAWGMSSDERGRFVRGKTSFHDWVTADGSSAYAAAAGRYHLYVSFACPWAHRTLIFRRLKGLEAAIGVSVVHPLMLEEGWTLATDFDGATGDQIGDRRFLREVYQAADPQITTRVTVPVLWDRETGSIVNNESSEIIRMLNSAFDAVGGDDALDFYPEELREEIDAINAPIYDHVNNGVYKCGFAGSQEAYDEAFEQLFATLDMLEGRLEERRYLVGDRITEADWRLFTTLIRFDAVYVTHFKCNLRRIDDYPNLSGYLRELYQVPGVAPTVRLDHIKHHYYRSHESVNPRRIVAGGPLLDFERPHGRDHLPARPLRG